MPWRFRRSVRIAPGVRLNFGKKGASLSVGGHGVTTTYGPTGTYTTVSLPGTGLSYRQRVGNGYASAQSAGHTPGQPAPAPQPSTSQPVASQPYAFHGRLEQDGSVTFFDDNNVQASLAAITEIRRQNRAAILQWLQDNANQFNEPPKTLASLHLTTPSPIDAAAWSPPPFPDPQPQPPAYVEPPVPLVPVMETPTWLAAHLPMPSARVQARNHARMKAYLAQLDAYEQTKEQAAQDYAAQELAWESKLTAWETALSALRR